MDSDDISVCDRCEKQLKKFAENPELDIIGSNIAEFIDNTKNVQAYRNLPETDEQIRKFAKRRNPFGHPSIMFKRSKVLEAGNYREYYLCEDYDMWIRMIEHGAKCYNFQEILVFMRIGENFYKRRGGIKYLKSILKFKKEQYKKGFFSKKDYFISAGTHIVICLMPNKIRDLFYKKVLRGKKMSNKKVDIITLHRTVNYGSVLQAYATQYVLKKMGYDVEFIDYYPERLHMTGMLKRIKNKSECLKKSIILRTIARIAIFPSYIKRFFVFKTFVKKYINTTKKTYKTEDELEKDIPNADVYCTGSDQVWNVGWNEKIDYPFFLKFVPDEKKRIAYSASFGKSKLEDWEKKETKKLLERYSHIAMRENSGVKILEDLGINDGIQVLDPTLLLNKEEWKNLISDKYKGKKYIFMYNINHNKKLDEYANKLAKKKNLKLIYVSYNFHDCFKKGNLKCNTKVENFLSLIANAEYVLTDSFHCTAYSINFNKQVVVAYPEKFSTRLASIVELTGIENRVIDDYNDLEICDRPIDFEKANNVLEKERKKSLNFLKKAIEE